MNKQNTRNNDLSQRGKTGTACASTEAPHYIRSVGTSISAYQIPHE